MSLEHPLPPGMRDLLPEEAASRRALSEAILKRLELHGYRLVIPPAFELERVLARGLSEAADQDVLRFIEPESGEVAVLRPDMTPQVARMLATRLDDRPPPHRLAYEGTVVRRRASRAKKHRQIPQVGVELCGVPGAEGDLELLALAVDVLRSAAGLDEFVIDLSDAGIVRDLLAEVPKERARAISQALAQKDEPSLVELTKGLADGTRIVSLARIHGGRDALDEAAALLAGSRAEGAVARLRALFAAASGHGLEKHLTVDPGEVLGFSYYTGTIFAIYAKGPGEPIGGGGRYDDLLARFGAGGAAIGLGLDLDALAWAMRASKSETAPKTSGVVVVGPPNDERLALLRARGIPAVAVRDAAAAEAYAAAWGYARIWRTKTQTIDEMC